MKKKDLKKIAQEIAKNEKLLEEDPDNTEAKDEIMRLTMRVMREDPESMDELDEIIQEILKNF